MKQDWQNDVVYDVQALNLCYGQKRVLKDVNLKILEREITAIIGPSGCGKSSFIKSLNRIVDISKDAKLSGKIFYRGKDIFDRTLRVEALRSNVGMVFQKPNPFPKSIYDNVVYGPKIHGVRDKKTLDQIVETSLKGAALWDEVKDRLRTNAYALSGGQQQRLCIARCLAVQPDVILMDEPTSALDPIATAKIENLIEQLKRDYTIAIVTHSMQQAARISDKTAFFLMGELIEYNDTATVFNEPSDRRTADYIAGKFG